MAYFKGKITIHPACKAQIALLVAKKVIVLDKYLDFGEVFPKKSAIKLSKHFNINKYLIDLELGKQPLYGLIYNLRLVKLKILKNYLKTNLVNGFIRPSKSFAGAPMLFVQKPDGNLRLCIDY